MRVTIPLLGSARRSSDWLILRRRRGQLELLHHLVIARPLWLLDGARSDRRRPSLQDRPGTLDSAAISGSQDCPPRDLRWLRDRTPPSVEQPAGAGIFGDEQFVENVRNTIAASPALAPCIISAYTKNGKVVCFFKSAGKFNSRYATFGFDEAANLDEGAMWPTSFALKELTAADEKKIGALVKKAVS